MRFGIVQMGGAETVEENLAQIALFAKEAAESGCEAVCFPECCLTGYDPERAEEKAISLEDASLARAAELAKTHGIDLLIGFMEREGAQRYVTHALLRRDGTGESYRKTHLGKKESSFFEAGEHLAVWTLSCGVQVGIQLCVEGHFPEISQTLALRGADVIFLPHAVPAAAGDRKTLWQRYIPARSYDNRIYAACCNVTDGARFAGGCFVTGPDGAVIAEQFSPQPALVCFDVEQDALQRWREEGGHHRWYPLHRRKELYE